MKNSLFERHPVKTKLIIFCVTLMLIESGLRLYKESIASFIGNPFEYKIQYTPISDEFQHHITLREPNTSRINYPAPRDSFKPVVINVNSFGIRGPEPEPNTNGNPLILFVGDSFIAADQVEFENTFSEKLNNEFSDSINFLAHGVTSWAPTTEFSWIFHKGMSLKPDEIYLFLCWNDFFPAETYTHGDEVYRSEAIWKNGVPFRYVFPDERLMHESPKLYKLKQDLSQIEFVKLIYQGMLKIFNFISPPLTQLEAQTMFSKEAHKWPFNFKRNVDQTIDLVALLDVYLKNNDVKLIVTLIPNPLLWKDEIMAVKTYDEDWKSYIADLGSEPSIFSQSQQGLDTYLQEHFLHNNIEWLDLTKPFNQIKKNKKQLLYNEEDGHWNKFGHEVIFKILKKKYIE